MSLGPFPTTKHHKKQHQGRGLCPHWAANRKNPHVSKVSVLLPGKNWLRIVMISNGTPTLPKTNMVPLKIGRGLQKENNFHVLDVSSFFSEANAKHSAGNKAFMTGQEIKGWCQNIPLRPWIFPERLGEGRFLGAVSLSSLTWLAWFKLLNLNLLDLTCLTWTCLTKTFLTWLSWLDLGKLLTWSA